MKAKNLFPLAEGAVMVALAVVLDLFIPMPKWPQGGSVSISAVPIIYYSLRHGGIKGLFVGLVFSVIQLMLGFSVPPAGTIWAVILCVLLDGILAFSVLGTAGFISPLFGKYRITGYVASAVIVCFFRFIFSFVSGFLLWGSYAPEGQGAVIYSLLYNGGYMLPNALIAGVIILLLTAAVDPKTLRPYKKL